MPQPRETQPRISVIEVDVPLNAGEPPVPVAVPASTPEEAFRILYTTGDALGGAGARNLYYGSILEPIRNGYKARLENVERAILQRRAALGANASAYELRGLAQWAARQRATTARLWRLPTPSLLLGLEARDWQQYGAGGRTFENLLARNARRGVTGTAAYERILGSATVSNAEVNASLSRSARFLRRGGGILAVAGLAVTAHEIYEAPPEQRGAIAERHAIGIAGGLIGAEVGATLLAVGAGLLAATPPGWVVIAVGLVAGAIGAYIADRVFYPEDHRPVANEMQTGYAVNPTQRYSAATATSSTGASPAATILPVVRQVVIVVARGDTQESLRRRAYQQAAASVGLATSEQEALVQRWMRRTSALHWTAGDPSPRTDSAVRAGDIAASAGQRVIFEFNDREREELATLAAQH